MDDSTNFLKLLDSILDFLAKSKLNSSPSDFLNAGWTIDDISDNLNLNLSKELKTNIESRLEVDEYIEYLNPSLSYVFKISEKGFKFISNNGYSKQKTDKELKKQIKSELKICKSTAIGNTIQLTQELEKLTRIESRVTLLGHLQRGGIPSAYDRMLATRLGTACTNYIQQEKYGVMIASKGENVAAVPLENIVGKRKMVSLDHAWIKAARSVGTCLGDCMV